MFPGCSLWQIYVIVAHGILQSLPLVTSIIMSSDNSLCQISLTCLNRKTMTNRGLNIYTTSQYIKYITEHTNDLIKNIYLPFTCLMYT